MPTTSKTWMAGTISPTMTSANHQFLRMGNPGRSDPAPFGVQRSACDRRAAPLCQRAPRRDNRERERDQRVVAGERDSEETPRRLVAAHRAHGAELIDEAAAQAVERARTFSRPGPEFPFDTGVIDAEPGVPEHAD